MSSKPEIDWAPDAGVAAEADKMIEGKQPSQGLLKQIGKVLRKKTERDFITLANGDVVSGATGRFLREHPGAEYLGGEFRTEVRVRGGHGMERTELYNASKHSAEEAATKKGKLLEYVRIPQGTDKGRDPTRQKGFQGIWLIDNADYGTARCIGHTPSVALLRRIGYGPEEEAEPAAEDSMAGHAPA